MNSGRPARAVWKAYAVSEGTAANAKMALPAYQVEKLVLSGKQYRAPLTGGEHAAKDTSKINLRQFGIFEPPRSRYYCSRDPNHM